MAEEKKKLKPRGGNSPVIGDNGLMLQDGDNAKFLGVNIALFNMPNIDMDDVDAVAQRLSDYFKLYADNDMKPTVVGMAMALNGHSRQWLWAVVHDKPLGGRGNETTLPPSVTDTIKKAYTLMDKTEYVLTPNAQQDSDYNAEDIRERYLPGKALPPTTTEDEGEDS